MAETYVKKDYITPDQIAFFDLVMTMFCQKLLETSKPEAVAAWMESHHQKRLQMVFRGRYNPMIQHIKR
jgi:hypothetical protein